MTRELGVMEFLSEVIFMAKSGIMTVSPVMLSLKLMV